MKGIDLVRLWRFLSLDMCLRRKAALVLREPQGEDTVRDRERWGGEGGWR